MTQKQQSLYANTKSKLQTVHYYHGTDVIGPHSDRTNEGIVATETIDSLCAKRRAFGPFKQIPDDVHDLLTEDDRICKECLKLADRGGDE